MDGHKGQEGGQQGLGQEEHGQSVLPGQEGVRRPCAGPLRREWGVCQFHIEGGPGRLSEAIRPGWRRRDFVTFHAT